MDTGEYAENGGHGARAGSSDRNGQLHGFCPRHCPHRLLPGRSPRWAIGIRRPDLPAIILGKYPYVPHYVGVSRENPPPPESPGSLHRIDIEPVRIADVDHWLVSLRFFAHSGFEDNGLPIYKTIVGKKIDGRGGTLEEGQST